MSFDISDTSQPVNIPGTPVVINMLNLLLRLFRAGYLLSAPNIKYDVSGDEMVLRRTVTMQYITAGKLAEYNGWSIAVLIWISLTNLFRI